MYRSPDPSDSPACGFSPSPAHSRTAPSTEPARPSRPGRVPLANLTPVDQLRAPRLFRRVVQLVVGLGLFGVSMAMMIRGLLGQMPWDVLHFGLASHLPLSFGQMVIATSVVVLLLWIPLRQMPGLGTVLNAVLIGLATDATLAVLVAPDGRPGRVALMAGGIGLNGVASALYIGAQLGPGPRDGLMTGLSRRTGRSIRLVRTTIELTAVGLGWALGGVPGIGTLLYAVSIGPLTQLLLPWVTVPLDGATAGPPGFADRGARPIRRPER